MTDYTVPERVGLLLEAHASDPLNRHVAEICRVAVAEELRRIVTETTYGWAIGDSLRARADQLDPEGATR